MLFLLYYIHPTGLRPADMQGNLTNRKGNSAAVAPSATGIDSSRSGCPVLIGQNDPTAVPLAVAVAVPTAILVWGCYLWFRLLSSPEAHANFDAGSEHIFHGLFQFLFSLPLGLAIPHSKIKAAMSLVHGVTLLQAVCFLAIGLVWPHIGFADGAPSATIVLWMNIIGFWGNTFGILWASVTGAKCLLYKSKESVAFQAPPAHEVVLNVMLKGQGLCNIVAGVMMMYTFANSRLG